MSKKKKVTKKEKKRIMVGFLILVVLVMSLFATVATNFKRIIKNKEDTKILTTKYQKLLDEEEELKSEIVKMQDPNYVARYAKEKYLYSSEGELIIRID